MRGFKCGLYPEKKREVSQRIINREESIKENKFKGTKDNIKKEETKGENKKEGKYLSQNSLEVVQKLLSS